MTYPLLFSEARLGQARLRNRLLMMATVNNLGRNDQITPAQIAFYEERARGGVAAIVTEGLSVHPTSIPNPTVPLAYRDELLPDLATLARAVQRHGALVLGQLWHVGRNALWNPSIVPWSPSAERDPFSGSTPHELTTDEIGELVRAFVATAGKLKRAGFDGVEIHGAHGYLVTQFLSPWSNKRTDEYGGDTAHRARFVLEVLEGIRAECGPAFVVGLKLSIDEFVPGGLTLEESQRIVALIRGTRPPDYFGVSQANFASLERHVPDMRFDWAPFRHLATGIRDAAGGIPIVFMARVRDAAHAESLLGEGVADLIGMSRPLIADASLPRKAREGAADRTRPCIYCNVCWEAIHALRPIACIHAPDVGRELELGASTFTPAVVRRTVRIVGAGPAGLAAGVTAARRGHSVHVYDDRDAPGGQVLVAKRIPGREEYGRVAEHLVSEARLAEVEFHLGRSVDIETVEQWLDQGDEVLLATGSRPNPPVLEGAEVSWTLESALDVADWSDKMIVLIDELDDEPAYATAETLADRGGRVRILTRRPQIGRRVAAVSMMGAFRRLDEKGISVLSLHHPVRYRENTLVVRHVFSQSEKQIGEVDAIVWAGPYAARDVLARQLRTRGRTPRSIGDCYAPRGAMVAVLEGELAGREL